MFNVLRHRTLPGFEIALCNNHVAFKSESVTARFFEQSQSAGLTRSYLNTDIPVDYFYCPVPMDLYVLFFFGISVFVFAIVDITSSDSKYEFRHHLFSISRFNSDSDIAVAHFLASRPGT
jgi:hypothetical protein